MQQRRDSRYDLLSALNHSLEGAQLYARGAQEALRNRDAALAEYFHQRERASRLEAERAEPLDNSADCLEMVHWVGHFRIPRDRSLAAGRRKRAGA